MIESQLSTNGQSGGTFINVVDNCNDTSSFDQLGNVQNEENSILNGNRHLLVASEIQSA